MHKKSELLFIIMTIINHKRERAKADLYYCYRQTEKPEKNVKTDKTDKI